MSVLRSKRNISQTEYENTMSNLYRYSANRTIKLPKRRRKWLGDDIDAIMNSAYNDIIEASTYYSKDTEEFEEHKCTVIHNAMNTLQTLQRPLIVMWNVQHYDFKDMVEWASFVNQELRLLDTILEGETQMQKIFVLDWGKINSVEFLKNMSELHRYTHGKVANAIMSYDNTQGKLLIKCVNDAFCELIEGNMIIPSNKSEYTERRKHLRNSLSSLNKMNRSLIPYYNIMHYSENVMNEWSGLLVTEIRLVAGLIKSDKKRFGNFQ